MRVRVPACARMQATPTPHVSSAADQADTRTRWTPLRAVTERLCAVLQCVASERAQRRPDGLRGVLAGGTDRFHADVPWLQHLVRSASVRRVRRECPPPSRVALLGGVSVMRAVRLPNRGHEKNRRGKKAIRLRGVPGAASAGRALTGRRDPHTRGGTCGCMAYREPCGRAWSGPHGGWAQEACAPSPLRACTTKRPLPLKDSTHQKNAARGRSPEGTGGQVGPRKQAGGAHVCGSVKRGDV